MYMAPHIRSTAEVVVQIFFHHLWDARSPALKEAAQSMGAVQQVQNEMPDPKQPLRSWLSQAWKPLKPLWLRLQSRHEHHSSTGLKSSTKAKNASI